MTKKGDGKLEEGIKDEEEVRKTMFRKVCILRVVFGHFIVYINCSLCMYASFSNEGCTSRRSQ